MLLFSDFQDVDSNSNPSSFCQMNRKHSSDLLNWWLKQVGAGDSTPTFPLCLELESVDCRDFPGGPVVKNPPSNAGDMGSIPGWGTKIPHAVGQLSPRAATTELACLKERARMPQTTEPMCPGARAPQLERENLHTITREKPESRNERCRTPQRRTPPCCNQDLTQPKNK